MPPRISDRSVTSTSGLGVSARLCGRRKTPCSSRLYQMQNPDRSQKRILTRSPRRLKNTNRCPDSGSCLMPSRAIIANPSKLRRISAGWVETKIRTVGGHVSTRLPPSRSTASRHPDRSRDQCEWHARETAALHRRLDCRPCSHWARVVLPRTVQPLGSDAEVAYCQATSFEPSVSRAVAVSTSRRPLQRAGAGDNSQPGSGHSQTMPADASAKTAFCSSSSLSCRQYWPLCTSAWNCSEIIQEEKMQLAGRVPNSQTGMVVSIV